jgi:hypothetical protein
MERPASWSCTLRAVGTARATAEALKVLRKQPGPDSGPALPAGLLNHADEQTVVGVSAVLRAIADGQLPATGYRDWGVIGAPRFPGRVVLDQSLQKFTRMGPLSVSPLIVPFQSQHSLASMISLALHIHGPAVGIGGGSDTLVQALLGGLSLGQENALPGVWLVTTCWDPEPFSAAAEGTPPVCHAVALALAPARSSAGYAGPRLCLRPATALGPSPTLPDLVRYLTDEAATEDTAWRCPAPGGYELELVKPNAVARKAPFAKSA